MRNEDILQDKFGRYTGFIVPEGYFEEFSIKMTQNLPPYPEIRKPEKLSVWQRVKPYVYMAAMFAGIWLTMKVFHEVSSSARLSLDNPPEAIAIAMASYEGPETTSYFSEDGYDDYELMQEVGQEYASMDAFEDAFGYDLKPQYGGL